MKRFCLLCVPLLLLPLTAFAQEESKIAVETTFDVTNEDGTTSSGSNTLYYKLVTDDEENVTASVTSPAENAGAYSGVIRIPATITYDEVTYDVTAIESGAFSGCDGLTNLTIGENIASMGAGAVYNCSGLTELSYEAVRCGDVGSTESPSIAGCDNLVTLNIGENVDSLAVDVFYGCTAVTTLNYKTINIKTEEIGDQAYNGNGTFRNCTSLTTINIGESVEEMDSFLFANCSALTTVNFNAIACTTAGEFFWYAPIFYGCTNLTTINIGEKVTKIPYYLCAASILSKGDDYTNTDFKTEGFPKLTTLYIPSNVKEIGSNAFEGCTGISELTIAEGVETIGSEAFYGCSSLTEVTIPTTVTVLAQYAFGASGLVTVNYNAIDATDGGSTAYYLHSPFSDCESLVTVNIGKDVTSLYQQLFAYCTSLTTMNYDAAKCTYAGEYHSSDELAVFRSCSKITTVNIKNDVETIPQYLFRGCSGVTDVYFNAVNCTEVGGDESPFLDYCTDLTNVTIGPDATLITPRLFACNSNTHFNKFTTLDIPGNVEVVGDSAFYYCQALGTDTGSLTINEGVKKIGDYSFFWCKGLTTLTTPSSINYIGSSAFRLCAGLTEITLGGVITDMGTYSFYQCTALSKLTIVNEVKYIGANAFDSCSSLVTLVIPNSVESMGEGTFENCSALTSATIGTGLEAIPDNCFWSDGLTEAVIPDNVKEIGGYAYMNCSALVSVSMGSGLTSIGEYAFQYCSALPSVTIPGSEAGTSIGNMAFASCSTLENVVICTGETNSVTNIGNSAFQYCSVLTEVTIGEGVKSLGTSVFESCTALTTVHYNAVNCSIASDITEKTTPIHYTCTNLSSFEIGDKVETLPTHLLYAYPPSYTFPKLTELTIPESVTKFENLCFYYLHGLTTINFNAIESESSGTTPVFQACSLVDTIKVGKNVRQLPKLVFAGLSNTKAIYSYNPNPPACEDSNFSGPPILTCWLIDPEDRNVAYMHADVWKDYYLHSREMTVTIEPAGQLDDYYYCTRYSPYSYTLMEGLEGGIITGTQDNSEGGSNLAIEWKYNGSDEEKAVVPACTPLLIRSASNTSYPNETVATEDASATGDEDNGDDGEDNATSGISLHGNEMDGVEYFNYYANEGDTKLSERSFYTYADATDHSDAGTAADADKYYFYKLTTGPDGTDYENVVGFYWAASSNQTYNNLHGGPFEITGKKAWLAIPKTSGASLASIPISSIPEISPEENVGTDTDDNLATGGESGETTGIASFASDDVGEKIIYNLAGQRVNDMSRRGVYIVNGRKVVKK